MLLFLADVFVSRPANPEPRLVATSSETFQIRFVNKIFRTDLAGGRSWFIEYSCSRVYDIKYTIVMAISNISNEIHEQITVAKVREIDPTDDILNQQ